MKPLEAKRGRCGRCKRAKLRKYFHVDRSRRNGLAPRCKRCVRLIQAGHPEWVQRSNAKRQKSPSFHEDRWVRGSLKPLDLTREDYEARLKEQDYRCAICRTHISELRKRLAVDHVHGTKKIRGLLCHRCNPALGLFQENPELLKRATAYLEAAQ